MSWIDKPKVIPCCDMGNAISDAVRDTLAGNRDGAEAVDSVGVGGVFKHWSRTGGVWKGSVIA